MAQQGGSLFPWTIVARYSLQTQDDSGRSAWAWAYLLGSSGSCSATQPSTRGVSALLRQICRGRVWRRDRVAYLLDLARTPSDRSSFFEEASGQLYRRMSYHGSQGRFQVTYSRLGAFAPPCREGEEYV